MIACMLDTYICCYVHTYIRTCVQMCLTNTDYSVGQDINTNHATYTYVPVHGMVNSYISMLIFYNVAA